MRPRAVAIPAVLVWAWAPAPAVAHLLDSGFGPFYDGFAHLLMTPEDILVVTALALLAGLRGKECSIAVLFLLPLAWLAGAVAGWITQFAVMLPAATALVLIALGALVASNLMLRVRLVAGIALAAGLLHGLANGGALAGANAGALAIGGIVCAVFVAVALVAGQVVSLQREWARLTVRVVGSWIGAVGLFMLGWSAR